MKAIQTDRLVIRNFRVGDAEALFDYLQEPIASCFFSLKLADLAAAESEVLKRASDDEYAAVCLQESGHLIGDLFIHPDAALPDDPEKPQHPDTVSVGWNFNPLFSGKGYAFEAAQAMCAELFKHQSIRRIYAYVEDHNASSRRLCEKLGMRMEGLFLEYVTFQNDSVGNPIYENTMQYAILWHEWKRR
ncbi:N-acetyltransferase [Hwanghaeella grinnelliae]|uniref:N-acetyltransferase n=1 Tax=Hwanghaeella grinnelliae TaxID=2500179 RepID=A0A437QXY2_9PROT|nr:GNAT family N-acetyltransferase [Hwanghaeella grinnelliae]RVU39391.1 N-acetyltransferase [Hwanghaeella grinnelliae]